MLTIINGNQRRARRKAVLLGAQIEIGPAAFDCQVLDISDLGARVRTGAPQPIPEQVILRLRSGSIHAATRRWARGLEIGFSLAPCSDTLTLVGCKQANR